MGGGGGQPEPYEVGRTAWLSRGFEELLHDEKDRVYDVIIVGSGYGGAVAAAELAGCTEKGERISVCVLERGREYLPGMFPSRMADLPAHVRFNTAGSSRPRGRREGLFDIRIGPDVNAVLGNGLGGGSLINAGVMEKPDEAMLDGWPDGVRDELFVGGGFLDQATKLLGVENTDLITGNPPLKFKALEALAGTAGKVKPAPITMSLEARPTGEVFHDHCRRCGDCATGCNQDAKISLDTNLLAKAARNGAHLYTGATVLRIERKASEWCLHTVHTDEHLRKRQKEPAKLLAKKVILAAGTFGSTEILLRSKSDALKFSPYLGRSFSSNGDAIAVVYNRSVAVNTVGDEAVEAWKRHVGPTITGMLAWRDDKAGRLLIEEIAIPGALRRIFEEVVTTTNTLHELGEVDDEAHGPGKPDHDPLAVNSKAIHHTSAFVIMGNDGAGGALELVGGDRKEEEGDGAIRVRWPELRDHDLFKQQIKVLEKLVCKSKTGGRVLPNPIWQLMPEKMQFLFDNRHGPLLTVHPLGGCRMGGDVEDGVVNEFGQVFKGVRGRDEQGYWDDLVVLDGSIVRNALGINPALTITALALRAVRKLRDEKWGYRYEGGDSERKVVRPRFRRPPRAEKTPQPTKARLMERMSGDARLRAKSGGDIDCRVEITLRFEPKSIGELVLPQRKEERSPPSAQQADEGRDPHPPDPEETHSPVAMARTLHVAGGTLRVFRKEAWDKWRRHGGPEKDLDAIVEFEAPLKGSLTLLDREATAYDGRRCRALWAWWWNRGFRDSWQVLRQFSREGRLLSTKTAKDLLDRAKRSKALASRAGEVRQLRYRLRIVEDPPIRTKDLLDARAWMPGAELTGLKRLTYERKANPWRQLMSMDLLEFPGMGRCEPRLDLDTKYLAEQGVPLFEIVSQNDQVSALADVASFAAYFLRLLVNIHVWSFRKPESPVPREPQRLPAGIPGRLPEPAIREIDLDQLRDGTPVRVRLTRYRPRRPRFERPVVMIHGYSASGTTFAHHAVRPNMAEYFYARGHDVWVLDLRTSSGMPTARHPWAFEHAALADLPVAFEEICRKAGCDSVNVFAHCMGSAMFSMAVLALPKSGEPFFEQRMKFPRRIHRAALSQISPVVVMSPANIFRGYAMSYLRHFLPFANYEFRVKPDAGLADQLIDRLLATLPYPKEEFSIENPPWPWGSTAFVGTRHRMDALYGRDFSLVDENHRPLLDDEVLEYIDDLFGPLSIETVAQAIHFARSEGITNRAGRNEYVLPANIAGRWKFPTLSIHGGENGLSDVATLERFRRKFKDDANVDIAIKEFRYFGHQDGLIGRKAERVFRCVFRFLTYGETADDCDVN